MRQTRKIEKLSGEKHSHVLQSSETEVSVELCSLTCVTKCRCVFLYKNEQDERSQGHLFSKGLRLFCRNVQQIS